MSRDRTDGDGVSCSECGEPVPVVEAGQRSGPRRTTCSQACEIARKVRRQRTRRAERGVIRRPVRTVDVPAPRVSRVSERRVSRRQVVEALVKRQVVESASTEKRRPSVVTCAHCQKLVAVAKKGQIRQYCRGGRCQAEADRQKMRLAAEAAEYAIRMQNRLPWLVGPTDFDTWMRWRVELRTRA